MYYPDRTDYINFLFFLLDKFWQTKQHLPQRGHPERYSDISLIVFYVIMTLKGIPSIRAQHKWLYHHPIWVGRPEIIRVSLTLNPNTEI